MEKIKNKESVTVHILKSSNAGKYNPNTDYDNSDDEPTLWLSYTWSPSKLLIDIRFINIYGFFELFIKRF